MHYESTSMLETRASIKMIKIKTAFQKRNNVTHDNQCLMKRNQVKEKLKKMFSNCGTLASIYVRHGLAARKSLVLSTRSNIYPFRPVMNKISRNYCAVKTSTEVKPQINDRARSNEILEILDSPDKMDRDHKQYRSVI